MTSRTVAIFDFGYTLTSWDTAARFFRWLILHSPWRMVLFLATAPLLAPLFLFRYTRKYPVHFAVWVATFGTSHDQLTFLAKLLTILRSYSTTFMDASACVENVEFNLEQMARCWRRLRDSQLSR